MTRKSAAKDRVQFSVEGTSGATVDISGITPSLQAVIKVLNGLPFSKLVTSSRLSELAGVSQAILFPARSGNHLKPYAIRHGQKMFWGNQQTVKVFNEQNTRQID